MEQELYKTNYAVAIDWCNNNYVLCNNIPNIDNTIWNNMQGVEYWQENKEDEELPDIFQWFISDASQNDVDYLVKTFPGLLFTYSELLDCYILCVTHFGTGWDYVGWITTNKNAEAELGQHKQDII